MNTNRPWLPTCYVGDGLIFDIVINDHLDFRFRDTVAELNLLLLRLQKGQPLRDDSNE